MDDTEKVQPPQLDRAILEPVVARALNRQTVEIVDWEIQPLNYKAMARTSIGLYRVAGRYMEQNQPHDRSLILKLIHNPKREDHGFPGSKDWFEEITSYAYWKREVLINQSGLLDDLPGEVYAPRCYGVVEQADGSYWLWLEELHDIYGSAWNWTPERFRKAARDVGTFNGAYLAGRPLPDYPWLVQHGRRHARMFQEHLLELVNDTELWEHPAVRSTFSPVIAGWLRQICEHWDRIIEIAGQQPEVFCHSDVYPANLFAHRGLDGVDRTYLIDWASPGKGIAGVEIAILYCGTIIHTKGNLDAVASLREPLYEGYLEGVQAAEWQGDPRAIRFGYLQSIVLWGMGSTNALRLVQNPERAHWMRRFEGDRPIEEILAAQAARATVLLAPVDELIRLCQSLSNELPS